MVISVDDASSVSIRDSHSRDVNRCGSKNNVSAKVSNKSCDDSCNVIVNADRTSTRGSTNKNTKSSSLHDSTKTRRRIVSSTLGSTFHSDVSIAGTLSTKAGRSKRLVSPTTSDIAIIDKNSMNKFSEMIDSMVNN